VIVIGFWEISGLAAAVRGFRQHATTNAIVSADAIGAADTRDRQLSRRRSIRFGQII
jgi:hypothetical protein